MRYRLIAVLMLFLSSCSPRLIPVPDQTPVPPSAEAPLLARTPDLQLDKITSFAVADLSTRLSLDPKLVRVWSAESMLWPDSSLGCPQAGQSYVQQILPGYLLLLEAKGHKYLYHTDEDKTVILCFEEGLPSFPVTPGEIDDGKPWMPVE
jgi:hypothetical protein